MLIFKVESHNVGDILLDMMGRHTGVAFEEAVTVDGRSQLARRIQAEGQRAMPGKKTLALPAPSLETGIGRAAKPRILALRAQILRALSDHGSPMKKNAIVVSVGSDANAVGYQLGKMKQMGIIEMVAGDLWIAGRGAQKLGAKERPVIKVKTKKVTPAKFKKLSNGRIDGAPIREALLALLKNKGPLRAKEISKQLKLGHDIVGWQGVVLGKQGKITKSGGLWHLADSPVRESKEEFTTVTHVSKPGDSSRELN